MGPVLKVKRLKKSTSPKSNAVAKSKIKWEKPKKLISAQPGVTKIKNVKKRSFDPIKANRGVILLQNIPHGFYEDQMRQYFGQFGLVTRVRLARSERSGRSKGFAYIEFKVPEVAQIAADTMNNYIMFKHVLKTAYIPPEKQTYNFFRKDVTFTTDTNGQTSFSSDKIKSIEKEIQNINRVPTDEEHAKRLKRTEKTLQKQQKKYGVDLSNILVSGTSTSSTATDVEPKVVKKKEKATKKVAEKKPEAKREVKPVAIKKDKKKAKAADGDSKTTNGKSLLEGLMNQTYETDTSDDDFKIDHSFSASADESDGSSANDDTNFMDFLAPKLKAAFKKADRNAMDTSESEDDEDSENDEDLEVDGDSEVDGESEDDANSEDYAESDDDDVESDDDEESDDDDVDSEDDEPEIVPQTLKATKKVVKGVTSNGTVDSKTKAGMKRKLKEIPEVVSASSQSEVDNVAKKKKLSQNKKKEVVAEPEAPKVALKKQKQKQIRVQASSTPTTSSESESMKPQQKQKKTKLASDVATTSAVDNSSKPASVNKKMKKKQAKQNLNTSNSSLPETTSSEPDIPKQNVKKSKLKSKADSVAKPQSKVETNAKKIVANTAIISSPENVKQNKKNKKNKPVKGGVDEAKLNSSSTSSSEPEVVQNQKMKKKQKTNGAVNAVVSLESVMKPKKVKPVTSSLISDKKAAKSKVKPPNSTRQTNAWSTVSETDGGEEPKKGNATLKTIVRKKVPKKKSGTANLLEAKKVKQTPADLLNVVPSKVLKQNNQLKSKKKSK